RNLLLVVLWFLGLFQVGCSVRLVLVLLSVVVIILFLIFLICSVVSVIISGFNKFFFSVLFNGDVSEKVWRGKDVFYSYLLLFGCRVFVYILRDERFKFDGKLKQCIFMGYGYEDFSYR
ncbi:hypothetical protein DF186_14260, partial [Enterococcus hirae]